MQYGGECVDSFVSFSNIFCSFPTILYFSCYSVVRFAIRTGNSRRNDMEKDGLVLEEQKSQKWIRICLHSKWAYKQKCNVNHLLHPILYVWLRYYAIHGGKKNMMLIDFNRIRLANLQLCFSDWREVKLRISQKINTSERRKTEE